MSRKEALQIVANLGTTPQNGVNKQTNFLVLGNLDYSNHNLSDGKSSKLKKAEKLILDGQDLVIISENVFIKSIDIQ